MLDSELNSNPEGLLQMPPSYKNQDPFTQGFQRTLHLKARKSKFFVNPHNKLKQKLQSHGTRARTMHFTVLGLLYGWFCISCSYKTQGILCYMQVREVGRFCSSCIIVASREIMSLTGKAFWLACWREGG